MSEDLRWEPSFGWHVTPDLRAAEDEIAAQEAEAAAQAQAQVAAEAQAEAEAQADAPPDTPPAGDSDTE